MILITGCARSGTSLTTGIFQACGANLGEVNGLNEHTFIRDELVKPYLRYIGADPMGQDPLPDLSDVWIDPDWRQKVTSALDGANCYKGAKMCLVWPLWKHAFPEAKWIIVRRDPEKIVDSCVRTSFMRAFKSRAGWQEWVYFHLRKFEEMKAELDVIEVWPNEFIAGDESGMKSAVEFAGLEWNREAALGCLRPTRWHG